MGLSTRTDTQEGISVNSSGNASYLLGISLMVLLLDKGVLHPQEMVDTLEDQIENSPDPEAAMLLNMLREDMLKTMAE
jgi:hypothetical protein